MSGRVVVLGAGPTGLGTVHRLLERGHTDVLCLEAEAGPGGLAASITDEAGWMWDLGAHLQFSHYEYFDRLMVALLGDEWVTHTRSTWFHTPGGFVPYPLQLHLDKLPEPQRTRCLDSAARASKEPADDYLSWLYAQFGEALAEEFLIPLNEKSWAVPLASMGTCWVGERVARSEDRAKRSTWGPNHQFHYPRTGGSGRVWRALADSLPEDKIRFGVACVEVRTENRELRTYDGEVHAYDHLVSTIPLDRLVAMSDRRDLDEAANGLVSSAVHIVGLGVAGATPAALRDMHWAYFSRRDIPFHRATLLSNYALDAAPAGHWSVVFEVAETPHRPVDHARIREAVIAGALEAGIIQRAGDVVHSFHRFLPYGYPTPTRDRDSCLAALLPALSAAGVHSRGRFGAWKYEVSNQDHSLMQGVELADWILDGTPELTLLHPALVNQGHALPLPRDTLSLVTP